MRCRSRLALACLAAALLLAGCGSASRAPAHPAGVRIIRDCTFATRDGAPLHLDLYLPEDYAQPLPIVIWLHGGGWMFGSHQPCPLASLATRGYAVASVGYGLSDRTERTAFPAPLHDCKAAVRWLRANAWRFGCDGARIGVWGLSAGAHLAALLGTTAGEADADGSEGVTGVSSAVQGVVCLFAATDLLALEQADPKNWRVQLLSLGLLHGRPSERPELARAASPALRVGRDSAPFLLIHGRDDAMIPADQSERLHVALQAAGVPSTLLLLDHLPHADAALDDPQVQAAAHAFLDARLHPVADPIRGDGSARR
jgi:acetyl esterase/lipase